MNFPLVLSTQRNIGLSKGNGKVLLTTHCQAQEQRLEREADARRKVQAFAAFIALGLRGKGHRR